MHTTGCPSVSNLIRKRQLASLDTWHVWTLNRITIGSSGRRSDRPVIGGDLVDGLVPAGWGRLILMYVQSVNIGIHSAWRKASDRTFRWRIVDMATLRHRSRTQPLKKKLSGVKYCESVRPSVCLFARVSQNRISGPTRNITCLLHEDMAVTRTSSDYSAAC